MTGLLVRLQLCLFEFLPASIETALVAVQQLVRVGAPLYVSRPFRRFRARAFCNVVRRQGRFQGGFDPAGAWACSRESPQPAVRVRIWQGPSLMADPEDLCEDRRTPDALLTFSSLFSVILGMPPDDRLSCRRHARAGSPLASPVAPN